MKTKKIYTEQEAKIRKNHKIDLVICLIYGITVELYFGALNFIYASIPVATFNLIIKISFIAFILISILMFEIGYKKEKKNLAITGIEFVALATHALILGKSVIQSEENKEWYILMTSCIWPTYYCLKAMISHTIENRRRLKQISDISEIVKEEKPTKKVAKKRKT